jgi:hypothetical protein
VESFRRVTNEMQLRIKIFSFSILASAALLSNVATTQTQPFFLPKNPYEDPPAGAECSPCPFINALANHGYINRDGKAVEVFELADIMTDIFDVSNTVLRGVVTRVVISGLTTSDGNSELLDIDDLFLYRISEHDASLTRLDHFFGPAASKPPNNILIDDLLSISHKKCPVVTIADMKLHQRNRILDGRRNNPDFNITGQEAELAGEAVLLLTLGSQNDLGFVRTDRLDTLLKTERIPDDYIPGKQRDPKFVPFDFSEGSVSGAIRAEFLDNVNAALAEDLGGGGGKNNKRSKRGKGTKIVKGSIRV